VDEVFDEPALLKTVQGDRALLGELTSLFLDEAPTYIGRLRFAIDGGDALAVRSAAHTLKGSAATLTAHRVAALARDLEMLAASGDLARATEILPLLEGAIGELRDRLTRGSAPAG
jgi:HPt (histidine-containing phosphotransfer) domain-containing protein